jgi:hypothetical protein
MLINKTRSPGGLVLLAAFCALLALSGSARGQNAGSPHDPEIYGVRVGMDVPTALQAVFINAKRQPGQEKPDALHNEGNDKRVLYKLKQGNLQIVFADGKWVREIQMEYAKPIMQDDLKLLNTSNTFGNSGGETRRDDRYSVGFTGDDKKERYWWRDENTDDGYRIRVGFVSAKLVKGGLSSKEIVRKIVGVVPEDKNKFAKAVIQN